MKLLENSLRWLQPTPTVAFYGRRWGRRAIIIIILYYAKRQHNHYKCSTQSI